MAWRPTTRITECAVLQTGDEDPILLVSRILEACGVRIRAIDMEEQRIVGMMGSHDDFPRCKVNVRLYSRDGVSLVEALLELPRWGGDPGVLAPLSARLKGALGRGLVAEEEAAWTRTVHILKVKLSLVGE